MYIGTVYTLSGSFIVKSKELLVTTPPLPLVKRKGLLVTTPLCHLLKVKDY